VRAEGELHDGVGLGCGTRGGTLRDGEATAPGLGASTRELRESAGRGKVARGRGRMEQGRCASGRWRGAHDGIRLQELSARDRNEGILLRGGKYH
jgi:hypothetical protein